MEPSTHNTDSTCPNCGDPAARLMFRVVIPAMSVGALVLAALILLTLPGCQAQNKANTGHTSLKATETVYDAATGKPLRETVQEGESVGPSAQGDLSAVKLTDGPATIDLPGGFKATDAGAGLSAKFWGTQTGKVVLYAIGGVLVVGGAAGVYFGAVGVGLCMAALGAVVIAATLFPILWLLAAVAVVGWAAYSVWHARKSGDNQKALEAIVPAVEPFAGVKQTIAKYALSTRNAVDRAVGRVQRKQAGKVPVAPAVQIPSPASPAAAVAAAFPGAAVSSAPPST